MEEQQSLIDLLNEAVDRGEFFFDNERDLLFSLRDSGFIRIEPRAHGDVELTLFFEDEQRHYKELLSEGGYHRLYYRVFNDLLSRKEKKAAALLRQCLTPTEVRDEDSDPSRNPEYVVKIRCDECVGRGKKVVGPFGRDAWKDGIPSKFEFSVCSKCNGNGYVYAEKWIDDVDGA